jgi:hypothetical protein
MVFLREVRLVDGQPFCPHLFPSCKVASSRAGRHHPTRTIKRPPPAPARHLTTPTDPRRRRGHERSRS